MMAFNAHWSLEQLAQELNTPLKDLLVEFELDLAEMIENCPVFRLGISKSGNFFRLHDHNGFECQPDPVPGLYSIFAYEAVVYLGEATDLYRRQLKDPDNTADSGKIFTNQGRAIIKLVLHKGWAASLGLDSLFIQLYPSNCRISRRTGSTFEECYMVDRFSKALEGAMSLFVHRLHPVMVERAKIDRLVNKTG